MRFPWKPWMRAPLLVGMAAACATAGEPTDPGGPGGGGGVPLYDIFTVAVENTTTYSNPFDFTVIELRATFTAPSGRRVEFFGFYDGGSTWRLRFMPDETGTWSYAYRWTDGTAGGEGSFQVTDTGLPGPLRVASDNPWYFMNARGEPFHARPYGMHHYMIRTSSHRLASELTGFTQALRREVVDRGYNVVLWPDMGDRLRRGASAADEQGGGGPLTDSWWADDTNTRTFSLSAFRANEEALLFARQHGVYVLTFAGMIDQGSHYAFTDFRVFLRYFVARMAPFYNYFGWSPTWEWMDIWTPADVQQIQQYVHDIDPWKRLLTAHDNSHSTFTGWLGFSMRQAPSRTVFQGNSRRAGQQQIADPNGSGGIGNPFIDRPIIGSEDIWESPIADQFTYPWSMPRTGDEAVRAAWGIHMAGVIPLYDEWSKWSPGSGGDGEGEPHVRRMFDFLHGRTRYRQYVQLNSLVSAAERQVASGVSGEEYLVYDEDGGEIALDLRGAPGSRTFSVLWLDPKTGAERGGGTVSGGAVRTLTSPFGGGDVVLLLRRT